ncbi:unnamed protein product [Arabidopsis lyrata]|nr:unnamed protein product [Arabidopsis lyrata]
MLYVWEHKRPMILMFDCHHWLSELIKQNHDLFYFVGASGLGLSLFLIHIYNLVHYVVDHPSAVWFVGPLFQRR